MDAVAAHLGVRKDSVYRWIEKRGLPARKIGKLWKLKLSEVDDWVRQSGEAAPAEPSPVALRDQADQAGRRAASVLVIDDDPLVRETLGEYLTECGYAALVAGDGAEALAKLTSSSLSGRPHVIILDLGMPNLDGWKFREQQKRDPALAAIPVIVVTATANPNIDAAAILRKPLRLPLLTKAMDTVLAREHAEERANGAHEASRAAVVGAAGVANLEGESKP